MERGRARAGRAVHGAIEPAGACGPDPRNGDCAGLQRGGHEGRQGAAGAPDRGQADAIRRDAGRSEEREGRQRKEGHRQERHSHGQRGAEGEKPEARGEERNHRCPDGGRAGDARPGGRRRAGQLRRAKAGADRGGHLRQGGQDVCRPFRPAAGREPGQPVGHSAESRADGAHPPVRPDGRKAAGRKLQPGEPDPADAGGDHCHAQQRARGRVADALPAAGSDEAGTGRGDGGRPFLHRRAGERGACAGRD